MNPELLGALIGVGGALLGAVVGSVLQYLFTQNTERKNRLREIKKNRIDKCEQIAIEIYNRIKEVASISQKLSENSDPIYNQKIYTDFIEETKKKDTTKTSIQTANIISVNDKDFNKFISELIDTLTEIRNIFNKFDSFANESDPTHSMKTLFPRIKEIHLESFNIYKEIIDRLDYLKSQ